MDFTKAQSIFETSRKRKLTGNTYLEKNNDGSYAIRLHSTQIIKFYPDKTVLDSGGWRTVTTKERINRFTSYTVSQKQGVWYICKGYAFDKQVVFADGIVCQNGSFTNTGESPKKTQKTRTKARQYAKDFVSALFAGKVERPGAGDCFYCGMATVEDKKPLGETLQDTGHILSHIEESYFVPSLLVNAVNMFPVSMIAQSSTGRIWQGHLDLPMDNISKIQIEKSIRRYCYRQLKTA